MMNVLNIRLTLEWMSYWMFPNKRTRCVFLLAFYFGRLPAILNLFRLFFLKCL